MPKVVEVNKSDGTHYAWKVHCPGCDGGHYYDERWTYNGDPDAPTFNPSYLARRRIGPERTEFVCHTFVEDGKIRYLDDCTHQLAGRVLDLEPIED